MADYNEFNGVRRGEGDGVCDSKGTLRAAGEECGESNNTSLSSSGNGCQPGAPNETGDMSPVAQPRKTAYKMRFCHKCGAEMPGGLNFCRRCGADLRRATPTGREAVNPNPAAQHKANATNLNSILAVISVLAVPTILNLVFESLLGYRYGIGYRWTFMLVTWLCAWAILLPLLLYPLMVRAMRQSRNAAKPMWVFTLVVPLIVVILFIAAALLAQAPFLSFVHWVQRQAGIYDISRWLVVVLFVRIAASALPCTAYTLLLFRAARIKTLRRFWWCAPLGILALTLLIVYLLTAVFRLGAYGIAAGFMIYGLLALLSLPLICRAYKSDVLWTAAAVSLVVLTVATVLTMPRAVSHIGAEPAAVAQTAGDTSPETVCFRGRILYFVEFARQL